MTDAPDPKAAARRAGFARRKAAFDCASAAQADTLGAVLAPYRGAVLAGYLPIRTEIDPRPAMALWSATGVVGVPVITGAGQPLRFSRWVPGAPLRAGPFGAEVPQVDDWVVPDVVIVPLVAFTRGGGRLGYGGGFYDRTLQQLRATRPLRAIGFAFAAQEDPDLPLEATDQPLDLIVTERGVIVPGGQ